MINFRPSTLRLILLAAILLMILSTTAVIAASAIAQNGIFDAGMIAFVLECNANTDGLMQIDLSHRIQVQLSNRYDRIFSMSFSPYGSWLVFEAMERNAQAAFSRHVYAIDLETNDEYQLAPEYASFNGTPIHWQPDGKFLELRMLALENTALEDTVVNASTGEVVDSAPTPDTAGNRGLVLQNGAVGTMLIPAPISDDAALMNNRVDADTSADGQTVHSRIRNGSFDLYIESPQTAEPIQITDDNCIERYPRWQPRPV